jgi:hemerythrin-like domain-containing protein
MNSPNPPSAIQTMMDEHQTILRVLACLEKLVSDERCAGEPADTFAKAARFLREYADALHHGKEEDLLFPAMESSGLQAEAGPTAVMRIEHDEGRALVRRMRELGEAPEFDRAAFTRPALDFVVLLRAHIAKEDHILYPMARRILRESSLTALDAACARADAANFDPQTTAAWETWARELARRLGVDQDRYEVAPACH